MRRWGAVIALVVVLLGACGDDAAEEQAEGTSTTSTTSSTSTTTSSPEAEPFGVTVDEYVARWNDLQAPVLNVAGSTVGELRAEVLEAGLFGGEVGGGVGVYVAGTSPGDGVRYLVVTARGETGSVSSPTRLLAAAASNLFPPTSYQGVVDAFNRDALPALSSVSDGKVVTVGEYVDLHIAVLDGSSLGFVFTRIGSAMPEAVGRLQV